MPDGSNDSNLPISNITLPAQAPGPYGDSFSSMNPAYPGASNLFPRATSGAPHPTAFCNRGAPPIGKDPRTHKRLMNLCFVLAQFLLEVFTMMKAIGRSPSERWSSTSKARRPMGDKWGTLGPTASSGMRKRKWFQLHPVAVVAKIHKVESANRCQA